MNGEREETGEKMESPDVQLIPRGSKRLCIDDMPPEIVLKILEYSSRNELIAAQCVCVKWRPLAHDRSLWKDYVFEVHGTQEDIKKLKVMPALRNIHGCVKNSFLNVILDHVRNLEKMNCIFTPPVSSSQVQSLVQRCPELQSITLDVCAPEIIQSLDILCTYKNLRELIFQTEQPCNNFCSVMCPCFSFLKIEEILNVFADCMNFTTLDNLDLGRLVESIFQNQSCMNAFTRVLANRPHQIRSLKLNVEYFFDVSAVNAVNMCIRMQNLHLKVYKNFPLCIDISKMPQLELLSVSLSVVNDDFIMALHDSLSRNSWITLTRVYLYFHNSCYYKTDFFGILTNNARQLKSLHYQDLGAYICDWQLQNIANLSKLEELSLFTFASISEEAISNVSCCYNLKQLKLYANSANIMNPCLCIAKSICSMKHLELLWFRVHDLVSIYLNGKEEIKQFISCYVNNE